MSAWEIEHAGPAQDLELVEMKRVAAGPYVASISARYKVRESEMTLTYELRAGDPVLYLKVAGTWFERGGKTVGTPVLRLSLPLAVDRPRHPTRFPSAPSPAPWSTGRRCRRSGGRACRERRRAGPLAACS